jgi:hypothetical protein
MLLQQLVVVANSRNESNIKNNFSYHFHSCKWQLSLKRGEKGQVRGGERKVRLIQDNFVLLSLIF